MESKNKKRKPIESKFTIISIMAILLVVGLWLINRQMLISNSPEVRGTFGDMFGAVNSVFSGLAFAGIIITIYLQREELKEQREELRLTRKEFEIQNTTLKLQRFENTFFNLLTLQNTIINSMSISKTKSVVTGISTQHMLYEIKGRDVIADSYIEMIDYLDKNSGEDFKVTYETYFQKKQAILGHYFRHLYNIFKFVSDTDFNNANEENQKDPDIVAKENFIIQYKYTSMVRAQFSNHEFVWLFYNGLSIKGAKFKPIIEKYALLNNLPTELLHNSDLTSEYRNTAYNLKIKEVNS